MAQKRNRLLQFLDRVSFADTTVGEVTLDQFNTNSVMQVSFTP